jgi:sugar O-acyltransferase (sialic acid O-acetyltransferase NeuD family)
MAATRLVIIGAGGFGREVHDVVDAINAQVGVGARPIEVVGYLADGGADVDLLPDGVPFLGPVEMLTGLPADVSYVIGIGSGVARRRIDQWAIGHGRQAATLIHPSAQIGRNRVSFGPGTIIGATCVVTTNVRVGRHVHLNIGATVGHDVVLGDYVTVNPQVAISGYVVLEDEVELGAASTVIPRRRIGARTVVGAGAAVIRDLPADVTAVGVPARPVG